VESARDRLRASERVTVLEGNYANSSVDLIPKRSWTVDGLLLDLGLLDAAQDSDRGFSFLRPVRWICACRGSLTQTAGTAGQSQEELARLFRMYGEDRNHGRSP